MSRNDFGLRFGEQAKANTGPTPSRAATFAPKRKKAMGGGFMARRSMYV